MENSGWPTRISLALQERCHFIHDLSSLRKEFICFISGRLSNPRAQFLAHDQQRHIAREDEIHAQISNGTEMSASFTAFEARSFFLTFAMTKP
jgi:hypothetical protein